MANKNTIVRFIKSTAPVASVLAPPLAARWLGDLFCTPQRRQVAQRELKWLQGSQRSFVNFESDIALPIWTWGRGPTVLLVHGWSGRGSQMAVMARPLVEAGFKVVALDLPGHGEAGGKLAALPTFARAIMTAVDQVGPLHGVIAHSLGTAGVSLAHSWGLKMEKAVYLAPPENLPLYLQRAGEFLGFKSDIAPRAQEYLEERYGVAFEEARAPALGPVMNSALLVIHDDTDTEVILKEGQDLVDHWPGARLITTHGHGHHRLVRNPEVVDMAVGFMNGALKAMHAY